MVIDLFCGQGGAGRGYADAGLDVVGVDNDSRALRRYPFPSYDGDWRLGLAYWLDYYYWRPGRVALIHASPVCKGYSKSSLSQRMAGKEYPNQIPEVREALEETGIPYVIENVPGAPLIDPVMLCGSQFGLCADVNGLKGNLKRHRLFEATFPIVDAGPHRHGGLPITVVGHGQPSWTRVHGYGPVRTEHWREAMGIDWMTRNGLAQAIPPAYTEYIGRQFMAATDIEKAA
jgi:DNA (cytosine-5)-methyltransferase 1